MVTTMKEFVVEAEKIMERKQRGEIDAGQAGQELARFGVAVAGTERSTPLFEEIFDLALNLETLHVQAMGWRGEDIAKLEEKEWRKFTPLLSRLKQETKI